MAKCKSCGEPVEKSVNLCPKCGIAGGPQTITNLPGADVKKERKKLFTEIEVTHEREAHAQGNECPECGTPFKRTEDVCPKCGLGGATSQTLTNLPMPDLREGRKKLKQEIKEAKEREKK
jgi:predicted amidophosphoribosyltransferase